MKPQSITFTAYGHVEPAHRPRATVRRSAKTGKLIPVMRNDARHTGWMESIRMQALSHRPDTLLDGPLKVSIDVYVIKPRTAKRVYPTVKPDLSNYVKAVEDALNGVLWVDDAQIVELATRKFYGNPSRVEVTIKEVMP